MLGRVLSGESDIGALVGRTDAKTVLVLRFAVSEGGVNYCGIDIEEKRDDELYLYRRDLAGRGTGLFLTGRITRFDLRALHRNLKLLEKDAGNRKAQGFVNDFLRKKLDWLPRGGVISDQSLLSALSPGSKATIESFVNEFKSRIREIHDDFLERIKILEPEELLLTVKLVYGSQEYYIGELPEYTSLFRLAVTKLREMGKATKQVLDTPACTVCNKKAVEAKFSQPPLPFVTTDKPGFIPDGEQTQAYKVFPLCLDCFLDLSRGMKFIEKHLDFSISSIEGRRAEVRFWLIPILSNPELVIPLIKDLGESATKVEETESTRFLYIRNLRKMCRTMDSITTLASESGFEAAEAYLTFTALFYAKDRKGHMRLISRSEGIYPKRLRFIAAVKRKVDSLYPFQKVDVRFGFPLLREFLVASKSERWYGDLASILGDIFTGKSVNKSLLYKAVANKIQEGAKKEADLKMIAETSFKGLSLIEYIEHLDPSQLGEEHLVGAQGIQEASRSRPVSLVKNFLDAHSKLLRNGTLRAICATGIATGILLEVQRETRKSIPFWTRLNRLEMDLERVKQLFPQILNKLHEYDFHEYDEVLAYLNSQEVSNLDLGQEDLSKDLISLVFAIGMSQGYWIVHEKGA
jgi:CRISPR-associated protein Csh1